MPQFLESILTKQSTLFDTLFQVLTFVFAFRWKKFGIPMKWLFTYQFSMNKQ